MGHAFLSTISCLSVFPPAVRLPKCSFCCVFFPYELFSYLSFCFVNLFVYLNALTPSHLLNALSLMVLALIHTPTKYKSLFIFCSLFFSLSHCLSLSVSPCLSLVFLWVSLSVPLDLWYHSLFCLFCVCLFVCLSLLY